MIVGEKPLTLTVINVHVLCYKEPTVTIKNKDDIYFPYFIRQTNAFIFSHIHRNTSRIKELAPSFFFLKFSKSICQIFTRFALYNHNIVRNYKYTCINIQYRRKGESLKRLKFCKTLKEAYSGLQ